MSLWKRTYDNRPHPPELYTTEHLEGQVLANTNCSGYQTEWKPGGSNGHSCLHQGDWVAHLVNEKKKKKKK